VAYFVSKSEADTAGIRPNIHKMPRNSSFKSFCNNAEKKANKMLLAVIDYNAETLFF